MANAPLSKQISYHAFKSDGSECAVSKNDDAVYIYKTGGSDDVSKWTETQVVTEHGGAVSGIDWCAKTNLIVTCGHDRNAYVWKYEDKDKAWKPTLVILRINRAATCVKWSPNGDKFAVGSGAKCVPVCHFEQNQNWWISKMIKKHKSSVLDIDWSPNQKFLVTGSSDLKCRVFSAFIEGIDQKDDDALTGIFGEKSHEFGECLVEYDQAKAWVQGVSWSPNGMRIAFAGHGSTLTFVHLGAGTQTIYQKCLPTTKVAFIDDNTLCAIGFDRNPTMYAMKGSDASPEWVQDKKLDPEAGAVKKAPTSATGAARNMFQNADTRGVKKGEVEEPEMKTYHKNAIVGFQRRGPKHFSTSGVDGRIVQWKL
jgi:actin related protein 2/3 complex subunit 1A/1B